MKKPRIFGQKYRIRKLTKMGRGKSMGVTLPIEGVRLFRWKERQKVIINIDAKQKRFIIEDWPGKKK